jgi:probable O-glycosylation ligase (exosortase A-associated)
MTKHLLLMIAVTLIGSVGVYTIAPFCGVAVYYFYAVLRPHYIWEWSLPKDVTWSFYVAIPTIIAAVLAKIGVISAGAPKKDGTPFTGAWSVAHGFILAFGGWIVLTYMTATNREVAFPTFQEYLKIFVMFAVSAILIRTPKQIWILFLLAGSSLAYIAYEVNYLYLASHYLGIFNNGYGGLDNNGAGLMLAMGVPLCYYAWEGMEGHPRQWVCRVRWMYLALIPVLIHAVLCTYSRGAMVSLIGMVPFLFLYSRKKLFLASLILFVALVIVPILAGKEIRARFFTIEQNAVDESAQSRRDSWNAAWMIAKDNPLLGVGVRNSPLFTHRYGADMEGRVVHNQYLQIAADNGLPGLVIYLACFVTVFRSTSRVRHSLKGRTDPDAQRSAAVASGVTCSLIIFCIGAIFLSLELVELPYLLMLLGAQLKALTSNPELAIDGESVPGMEMEESQDSGQAAALPHALIEYSSYSEVYP